MSEDTLAAVSVPLPWHAPSWEYLAQQIERGKLPHALLLAGAPGTGKARFAMALARLLLCEKPEAGTNCGHCHACELSAAGNHGDLRWLQPEDNSRIIKVDQAREAIAFSQGTAVFGRCKVVVFTPADRMNLNAYNALLKSLEEPAADTYLVLACDSLHGVPATIRSRCQLRRLETPGVQQSIDWLQGITGDAQLSEQLLALADQRPLLAGELYRSDTAQEYAAQRAALCALFTGEVDPASIWDHFAELEADAFLALVCTELRQQLRRSGVEQLRSAPGREAFNLLDRATELQRAVTAGANPGRQLLTDLFLSKSHRVLGR
ncbi:MAG: DNA polymerase III subunit delta' [Halioglobus sp.]|nr:DNA polymerase III subunit delta' [Halioglobus sp.]